MKAAVHWLKQYVDFDWSPDELAERLTLLGLEVEGVQRIRGEFDGIVVAEVLSRESHPNADKLSLCRVHDGRGERQIVCGAHNFKAGDKVPLILPGASLPSQPGQAPFTIKVGKIRGVESHGMLCSAQELGLSNDAEGLHILRADAEVGQSFAEYLGRAGADTVLDLEITPNRPDLNSYLGIAREIAASTGLPLRLPYPSVVPPEPTPSPMDSLLAVRLDAPDLCPRYTARIIRGIRVGPSPDWLRQTLEKVGVRSINNVVDITNYVMLETGQPLHAFDYHLIASRRDGPTTTAPSVPRGPSPAAAPAIPTIVVRRAASGELFTTLDGQCRKLSVDMLLIADTEKAIALAGVMGGQNSEIGDQTVDVLLESAWFLPTNIRRTSKALGLKTDASYRFERGADIAITDLASRRAAQLIVELAGGELISGVIDASPQPPAPRQIVLRHHKANELLGLDLPPEAMEHYLAQLGLKQTGRKPRPVDAPTQASVPVSFLIPSWRPDLKREIDLIEEIARLYGVDRIPTSPPRGAIGSHPEDRVYDELADIRQLLVGLGLFEAQGQTLIEESAATLSAEEVVRLSNPLSSDMNTLRPSLLPGLLQSLSHNLSRQNHDAALFEIGRVFRPGPGSSPREHRRVAVAVTGRRSPVFWSGEDRQARLDLHDLKGLLEEFLDQVGIRGLVWTRRAVPTALFVESATVSIGGKVLLGEFGQLRPQLARQFGLRDAALLAELNLDELLARRITSRGFKPIPAFPAVRRDLAMLLPLATTHDAVLAAVRQVRLPHLESVELFDVFQGQSIPSGQKSVAYAFTHRHPERTLTDEEVNAAHDRLVAHLQQSLGATVRA